MITNHAQYSAKLERLLLKRHQQQADNLLMSGSATARQTLADCVASRRGRTELSCKFTVAFPSLHGHAWAIDHGPLVG